MTVHSARVRPLNAVEDGSVSHAAGILEPADHHHKTDEASSAPSATRAPPRMFQNDAG